MKIWIALVLAVLAMGAAAQSCTCRTMQWATCDGTPCECSLLIGDNMKQKLNCEALVPKCFLMKAEMYRTKKGQRAIGGKPVEEAFVDNDGIYDPECENDGKFKAKQCNNTEECWCVNSAGVRRTDKGDKNLKCDKLVETYWVRLQLKHKAVKSPVDAAKLKIAIGDAIQKRYSFDKNLVKEIQYDPEARLIVADVTKTKGERKSDLGSMAYYMEKDVKEQPMFKNQDKFEPMVDSQKLEMESILVYYVDEEAPTFTMKNLSSGIIAVIVVVVLAVVIGMLVVFFVTKRQRQRYSKAQQREMEAM